MSIGAVVVEDHVELRLAELDLLVGADVAGVRPEDEIEGHVHDRRDRLAAGDAALSHRSGERAAGADFVAVAGQRRLGGEPADGDQAEAPRQRRALASARLERHCVRSRAERVGADGAAEFGRGHALSLPSSRAATGRASRSRLSAASRCATSASASSEDGESWKILRRAAAVERAVAAPRRAEGGQPPAERTHHPADMLADDMVADAELAQSRVHVVDEQLGQQPDGLAAGLTLGLEPEQDQSGHRRDHVEAAVDRIGHPALAIPEGIAAGGDRGAIKRLQRRALPGTAENPLQEGQDEPQSLEPLAPVGRCSYWRG